VNVTRVGAVAGTGDTPYTHPRPFRREESHLFAGRAPDASKLSDLWRTNRLVIAHGRTGSGKTSLLQAGVLPEVQNGSAHVLPPGRFAASPTFPLAALPDHNPYTLALLKSWSPGESPAMLASLGVREFIRRQAERYSHAMLAVIDQAEELASDVSQRQVQARRFLGELTEALQDSPSLHLLILVRETAVDLYSAALGGGAHYEVGPLRPSAALEVVTASAGVAGRALAADAAQQLVTDLQTSRIVAADGQERSVCLDHVEPALLQAACIRLWASLSAEASPVTAYDVRQYGDVDATLAAYCGSAVATVAQDHELPEPRVQAWLVRNFLTETGTRGTVSEGITSTAGLPNAVARALEDQHLLSTQQRSRARWYELLSDRLTEPLKHASHEPPSIADPAAFLATAARALLSGDLDLALDFARRTLRRSSDTEFLLRAEAHSLLGDVAYERDETDRAQEEYHLAAELFEAAQRTEAVAHHLAAVGRTMLAQGRTADAVAKLQAAARRAPHDLAVQTELGWALWQQGQRRAGVAVLTNVLAIDGRNTRALRARGEMLADLDDPRDAIRDLDRAISPGRPSAQAARGLAHAELGQYGAADRDIADALADAPGNGPVLFYAARAAELGGDKDTAAKLAERAIDATDPPLPGHQRVGAEQLAGQD
jgi:tetratricopeptide (TPR) repeat protein